MTPKKATYAGTQGEVSYKTTPLERPVLDFVRDKAGAFALALMKSEYPQKEEGCGSDGTQDVSALRRESRPW